MSLTFNILVFKYTNKTDTKVSLSNAGGLEMTEYLGIPGRKND